MNTFLQSLWSAKQRKFGEINWLKSNFHYQLPSEKKYTKYTCGQTNYQYILQVC